MRKKVAIFDHLKAVTLIKSLRFKRGFYLYCSRMPFGSVFDADCSNCFPNPRTAASGKRNNRVISSGSESTKPIISPFSSATTVRFFLIASSYYAKVLSLHPIHELISAITTFSRPSIDRAVTSYSDWPAPADTECDSQGVGLAVLYFAIPSIEAGLGSKSCCARSM